VWRLMRAAGLRGRHPRAWKKTTIAGQRPIDAPDLIGQDFTAGAPNTRWCGDITYIRTVEGWVSRSFQDHGVSLRILKGRCMLRLAARVASVMSRRPVSRMAPMARLGRAAMTRGPERVRAVEWSSR